MPSWWHSIGNRIWMLHPNHFEFSKIFSIALEKIVVLDFPSNIVKALAWSWRYSSNLKFSYLNSMHVCVRIKYFQFVFASSHAISTCYRRTFHKFENRIAWVCFHWFICASLFGRVYDNQLMACPLADFNLFL